MGIKKRKDGKKKNRKKLNQNKNADEEKDGMVKKMKIVVERRRKMKPIRMKKANFNIGIRLITIDSLRK